MRDWREDDEQEASEFAQRVGPMMRAARESLGLPATTEPTAERTEAKANG